MAINPTQLYSYGFGTAETYPALKAEMGTIQSNLTEAENKEIVNVIADLSGSRAKEASWKDGFFSGLLASLAVAYDNPEMGKQIGIIVADEKRKLAADSWGTKIYYGFMAALEYIGLASNDVDDSRSKNAKGFMAYLEARGKELAVADLADGVERRMTELETKYNPTLSSSPEYINIKKDTVAAIETQALAVAFGEKTSTSPTLASTQGDDNLNGNDGHDRLQSPGPTPKTGPVFAKSTISGVSP